MVSVGNKESTQRQATATGRVYINDVAAQLIKTGESGKKGDPLLVAQLAGIMGAKQTSNLIPLCHPLFLSHVNVTLEPNLEETNPFILISATVETEGKTGVEMEALTAVSVACLTVWDMLKAVSGKEMSITDIKVVSKKGGKSGDWSI